MATTKATPATALPARAVATAAGLEVLLVLTSSASLLLVPDPPVLAVSVALESLVAAVVVAVTVRELASPVLGAVEAAEDVEEGVMGKTVLVVYALPSESVLVTGIPIAELDDDGPSSIKVDDSTGRVGWPSPGSERCV